MKPITIKLLLLALISILFTDTTSAATYIYDANGRLIVQTNAQGAMEYQYDANGNLIKRAYNQSINMLANPNYEKVTTSTGLADNWQSWSTGVPTYEFSLVSTPVTSGKFAQRVTGSGMQKNGSIFVLQDVKVSGGRPYSTGGQVRVQSLDKASVYVFVQFFDKNDAFISGKSVVSPGQPHGTQVDAYLTLADTGVTPAAASRMRVHVGMQALADGASGSFLVDDMFLMYDWDKNIIGNSRFENATTASGLADGWQPWISGNFTYRYETVSSTVSSGKSAQLISSESMSANGLIFALQDVAVTGGSSYTAGGQVRVDSLHQASVFLLVQFYDPQGNLLAENIVDYPSYIRYSFVTLSGSGTIPAGANRMRIHIGMQALAQGGGGTFYIDDMFMQYDSERNLVANGHFENSTITSGVADGWQTWMSMTSNSKFEVVGSKLASGKKAQKVSASGITQYGAIFVLQDLAVTGGKPYLAGTHLLAESITQSNLFMLIQFFDANNNMVDSKTVLYPSQSLDTYQPLSISGITPSNANRMRIHAGIQATANNGGGVFYVDDMYFRYQ